MYKPVVHAVGWNCHSRAHRWKCCGMKVLHLSIIHLKTWHGGPSWSKTSSRKPQPSPKAIFYGCSHITLSPTLALWVKWCRTHSSITQIHSCSIVGLDPLMASRRRMVFTRKGSYHIQLPVGYRTETTVLFILSPVGVYFEVGWAFKGTDHLLSHKQIKTCRSEHSSTLYELVRW